MEFNVALLSRETITPSSPTPQSLRKYTLSFLDQMAPLSFISFIYFYTSDTKVSNSEKSNVLKKSLSRILTKFYPLAGRLIDLQYVDCNDEGAPYVEAEADCDLIQVIKNPKPLDMNKFLPYKVEDIQDINLAVQLTFFPCGSMALGLMVSHVIADSQSFFNFVKSWADVTRLEDVTTVPNPKFELASIFPPQDLPRIKPNMKNAVKEELVTKLFKFSASKISTLRNTYRREPTMPLPSRFAALSSFIFMRYLSATQLKLNPNTTFVLLLPANLRSRFEPPLSEDYFGNMSESATVVPCMGDGGYEIAEKVTNAVRAVNKEFVAKDKERDEKYSKQVETKMSEEIKGELVVFVVTNFCGFPVYEQADFGWGKPCWIGMPPLPYKNVVSFIGAASGDGIEASIVMTKEEMKKFETDRELQDYLSQGFDDGKSN